MFFARNRTWNTISQAEPEPIKDKLFPIKE